jgi:hypothetical protein
MTELLTYLPGLYVLIIFSIGAGLMITKKLPALLTLPLMALVILAGMVLYGNMPFLLGNAEEPLITKDVVFTEIIGKGLQTLSGAMIVAFMGGILSFIMQKSGVAEQMIKNGAELIGDNPLGVGIFCMTLVGILFTTIGGLGAVIMVSIVLLPLMATVGIPPLVAAGVMLIGISIGGTMNAGSWVVFANSLNIDIAIVKNFAINVFTFVYAMGVCFITIEMWRAGALKSTTKMLTIVTSTILITIILVSIFWKLKIGEGGSDNANGVPSWLYLLRILGGVLMVGVLAIMLKDIYINIPRWRHQIVTIKWYAYLIPVVPLFFIILYNIDINSSFMIGIIYAMLATARPGSISLTIQSMIQGAAAVMPAVILFMGIGLIITVFKGPANWSATHGSEWLTIQALNPFFVSMKPTVPVYLIFFSIFAPMALYRGPLNTWGLGFGVSVILTKTVGFSNPIVMGMLQMVGQIQGVSDPTNTQNVWLANELRVDVQQIMLRTLPYVWVMAILGLIATTVFFPVDQVTWEKMQAEKSKKSALIAPATTESTTGTIELGIEVPAVNGGTTK